MTTVAQKPSQAPPSTGREMPQPKKDALSKEVQQQLLHKGVGEFARGGDCSVVYNVLTPIGGIAETQEMLDFCSQHNITADVEVIPVQKVNEAYEGLLGSNVKSRFSIDMASLKAE